MKSIDRIISRLKTAEMIHIQLAKIFVTHVNIFKHRRVKTIIEGLPICHLNLMLARLTILSKFNKVKRILISCFFVIKNNVIIIMLFATLFSLA